MSMLSQTKTHIETQTCAAQNRVKGVSKWNWKTPVCQQLANPATRAEPHTITTQARIGVLYNRIYDINTGRWTSPDPAASPWSNLQDYVGSNPISGRDPSGLDPVEVELDGTGMPTAERLPKVDDKEQGYKDFQKELAADDENDAYVVSQMYRKRTMEYQLLKRDFGDCGANYTVECRSTSVFNVRHFPKESTAKKDAFEGELGAKLLNHEQTHVKIRLLHAAYFNQAFSKEFESVDVDHDCGPPTQAQIDAAKTKCKAASWTAFTKFKYEGRNYKDYWKQGKELQTLYENESVHGTNDVQQGIWDSMANDELGELRNAAAQATTDDYNDGWGTDTGWTRSHERTALD